MFTLLKGSYVRHTLEQLRNVPITERRSPSLRWKGINHGELVDVALEVLEDRDIVPHEPVYAVSPNGAVMIGGFQLHKKSVRKGVVKSKPWKVSDVPQDTVYSMGIRHSNNSTLAVTCSTGAEVLVCENGLITGENQWKRRHTNKLDVRGFIKDGIDQFLEGLAGIKDKIQDLLNWSVSPADHDEMILEIARRRIVSWKVAGLIEDYWRKCQNNETPFTDGTGWDWYNAVTECAKDLPIILQPKVLSKSFSMVQEYAQYDVE